jgi:hypothetical protein
MSPRFAWPTFKDQWDCRMEQVLFDGHDYQDSLEENHLRIDGHQHEWQDARISLSAFTSEAKPDGLQELSAYAMVACGATQLRLSFPMFGDADSGFRGEFSIPRAAVAGKAAIHVDIVSNREDRLRIVGSSVPWTLVVDVSEAPPPSGASPIRTTWIDFGGGDAPVEARRNPLAHCYIDVSQTPPTLYLNSAIDGFQSLIQSETAKMERRRQRDLLGAIVARQITNSLVRSAVLEVTPSEFGSRATGPSSRILQDTCKAIAAELPQTENEDDFYDLVAAVNGDPGATANFWADVDMAIDKITSVSDTIALICREVKHV